MQLAIREMTQQATSPRFWAVLLCIICILTVAAPFSTDERFNTIQLFFYWGSIAISTYFSTEFVLVLLLNTLKKAGESQMTARVIASLAAAFTAALVVIFINTVVLGSDETSWKSLAMLGVSCMLIALAISTIFFIVDDTKQSPQQSQADSQDASVTAQQPENIEVKKPTSVFHQRLSKSLGDDVISLQAQDHYVDVKTTLGNELILIRLVDAIKELGEEHGIQVHRSWWVTHKHMTEQKRIDGKLHVLLSDNSSVPVSRTYSAAVKEALTQAQ